MSFFIIWIISSPMQSPPSMANFTFYFVPQDALSGFSGGFCSYRGYPLFSRHWVDITLSNLIGTIFSFLNPHKNTSLYVWLERGILWLFRAFHRYLYESVPLILLAQGGRFLFYSVIFSLLLCYMRLSVCRYCCQIHKSHSAQIF